MYPKGFYVVFVMHGDNTKCTKSEVEGYTDSWFFPSSNLRKKQVSFVIHEKITDIEYLSAILGTIGIFFAFYVFSFIVSCAYLIRRRPLEVPLEEEDSGNHNQHDEHHNAQARYPPLHSSYPAGSREEQPHSSSRRYVDEITANNGALNEECENHWLAESDSSIDETDIDMLADADREKDVYR
jgi:hypothetical protein